jgi:membrane protease YdiL (CAAX protease family)
VQKDAFSAGKPLSKAFYAMGVVVIFLAVYSQYFVHLGVVLGYLVVYGIPIVVVSLFFGKKILSRAAKNNKDAFKYGLSLFGALTLVAFVLIFVVLAIILQVDPKAVDMLNKPNPVLNVPPNVAWVLIAVSFLVVGPAEEYIFRGFMYGGLLNITKGKNWLPLAIISSLMFAGVHAYYAVTYGLASALAFIDLVAFGLAMCITYYWTGGNILAAVVIHGFYDATGFLGVATTTLIGGVARGVLITVGIAFAVIYLPKKVRLTPAKDLNQVVQGEKPVNLSL